MSTRDTDPPGEGASGEPMLQRWSRLKAQARDAERKPTEAASDPGLGQALDPPPAAVPDTASSGEPPRLELPDLDLLGQDSDYSAFLAPGVEPALRQRALRKLFASPKFNVFDGLDTYRDDFTSFPALGSIVTADMRHQVERLAQEALAKLEHPGPAPAPAVASAGTGGAAPPEPDTPQHTIDTKPDTFDADVAIFAPVVGMPEARIKPVDHLPDHATAPRHHGDAVLLQDRAPPTEKD